MNRLLSEKKTGGGGGGGASPRFISGFGDGEVHIKSNIEQKRKNSMKDERLYIRTGGTGGGEGDRRFSSSSVNGESMASWGKMNRREDYPDYPYEVHSSTIRRQQQLSLQLQQQRRRRRRGGGAVSLDLYNNWQQERMNLRSSSSMNNNGMNNNEDDGPWQISVLALLGIIGLLVFLFVHLIGDQGGGSSSSKKSSSSASSSASSSRYPRRRRPPPPLRSSSLLKAQKKNDITSDITHKTAHQSNNDANNSTHSSLYYSHHPQQHFVQRRLTAKETGGAVETNRIMDTHPRLHHRTTDPSHSLLSWRRTVPSFHLFPYNNNTNNNNNTNHNTSSNTNETHDNNTTAQFAGMGLEHLDGAITSYHHSGSPTPIAAPSLSTFQQQNDTPLLSNQHAPSRQTSSSTLFFQSTTEPHLPISPPQLRTPNTLRQKIQSQRDYHALHPPLHNNSTLQTPTLQQSQHNQKQQQQQQQMATPKTGHNCQPKLHTTAQFSEKNNNNNNNLPASSHIPVALPLPPPFISTTTSPTISPLLPLPTTTTKNNNNNNNNNNNTLYNKNHDANLDPTASSQYSNFSPKSSSSPFSSQLSCQEDNNNNNNDSWSISDLDKNLTNYLPMDDHRLDEMESGTESEFCSDSRTNHRPLTSNNNSNDATAAAADKQTKNSNKTNTNEESNSPETAAPPHNNNNNNNDDDDCHEPSSSSTTSDDDDIKKKAFIKRKRLDISTDSSDASSSLTSPIHFSELNLKTVIGGGGFGQVWRATWRGTPVAVKLFSSNIMQKDNVPKQILDEFVAEINMVSGMRHPNVCLYMGACLEPPHRAIVTELAANGSLWDALRQPLDIRHHYVVADGTTRAAWPLFLYGCLPSSQDKTKTTTSSSGWYNSSSSKPNQSVNNDDDDKNQSNPPLPPEGTWPWVLVKRVAYGAARGMTYLHSGQPPVLHRDLKSANLLLDESYNTKVADFGLSRLKAQEHSMTGNCGTVQWMAPEILAIQSYAEPADVYSYGIILSELLTRKCPYDGMSAIQCALAVLTKDARPDIPPWCPPALETLIHMCLERVPSSRPTFPQIIEALDAMP